MIQATQLSANRSLHCHPSPQNKVMFGSRFDQNLFRRLNSNDPRFIDGFISGTYTLMDVNPSALYATLTTLRDFWPKFSETTKSTIEQQLAKYTHKFLNSEPIE